ncbi:hypothetical protein BD309DRAFT_868080 [Dichomitus squalens]|nr:hypothetical protein BD309DRAFT_868080 [Dichomitus squalens]
MLQTTELLVDCVLKAEVESCPVYPYRWHSATSHKSRRNREANMTLTKGYEIRIDAHAWRQYNHPRWHMLARQRTTEEIDVISEPSVIEGCTRE